MNTDKTDDTGCTDIMYGAGSPLRGSEEFICACYRRCAPTELNTTRFKPRSGELSVATTAEIIKPHSGGPKLLKTFLPQIT